jgi:exodeoxyribonuclease VII small subunit
VPKPAKPPDFERSLDELERIVKQMEDGELSLEESLKTFERGMDLSRACQKALDDAEQRVRILTERDGQLRTEPFTPDDPSENPQG